VRLLVVGERYAPIVLALLGAPAASAGAAALRVLAGWLRLSAATAAPLGRRRLRGRAWASVRLLRVLRTCGRPETQSVAVQLLADELDDDALDKLGDGAAQLVPDERLERLGGRGHGPESTTRSGSILHSWALHTPPPRRAKTASRPLAVPWIDGQVPRRLPAPHPDDAKDHHDLRQTCSVDDLFGLIVEEEIREDVRQDQ
jgi:hypothetical protein